MDELDSIARLPISILVENVRSVHNVGSIFRSADGFGAEMVYLTGYTAYPPREDLHKTALGSEDSVPWEYHEDPIKLAIDLEKKGVNLALIEQTYSSAPLYDIDWEFPICFIVGNEVDGVSEELAALCSMHAEIPMKGIKQSLNVSVATGIIGYEIARKYEIKAK